MFRNAQTCFAVLKYIFKCSDMVYNVLTCFATFKHACNTIAYFSTFKKKKIAILKHIEIYFRYDIITASSLDTANSQNYLISVKYEVVMPDQMRTSLDAPSIIFRGQCMLASVLRILRIVKTLERMEFHSRLSGEYWVFYIMELHLWMQECTPSHCTDLIPWHVDWGLSCNWVFL